jgi:hypothetical protein
MWFTFLKVGLFLSILSTLITYWSKQYVDNGFIRNVLAILIGTIIHGFYAYLIFNLIIFFA